MFLLSSKDGIDLSVITILYLEIPFPAYLSIILQPLTKLMISDATS